MGSPQCSQVGAAVITPHWKMPCVERVAALANCRKKSVYIKSLLLFLIGDSVAWCMLGSTFPGG